MASTGFFDKSPNLQPINAVIKADGELFHAVAIALIDNIKHGSRYPEAPVKKLLEQIYTYYPETVINQPYLTAAERLNRLVRTNRSSKLVECMAFVLRQIVVDEILASPLNYREVFHGLSANTPKTYLCEPSTTLPISAIKKALDKVLSLDITLSFKEHGKELRKLEPSFNAQSNKPKFQIMLQVQGDNYFPYVKNKSDYFYVGQLAIAPPKPVIDPNRHVGTIADIVNEIAKEDKLLLADFEHKRRMLNACELSKGQLINLYIEFIPTYPAPTAVSLDYIEKLKQVDKTPVNMDTLSQTQQYEANLLINTMASWMCTKLVDENKLFERIENKPIPTFSRKM